MGPVAVRVYAGSYMTSLNAPGFSISLLNVSTVRLALSPGNPDVLHLLDDPTDASAWTGVRMGWSNQRRDYALEETWTETLVGPSQRSAHVKDDVGATGLGTADPDVVAAAIRGACTAVLEVEADLTKFDTATGDGDCGETFTQAAKGTILL
jgi:dihydroxyacetone kinase